MEIVLKSIGSDGAHIDHKSTSKFGKVSSFLGVVGHDGACPNTKSHIGGKVLNNLVFQHENLTWPSHEPSCTHQVGHIVRKGRLVGYGPDNFGDFGNDDFTEEITSGGSWLRSSDESAHYSNAIERLGGAPGCSENSGSVAGVDTAYTNSRDGAISGII